MTPHRVDPRIGPAPNSSPPATQHPACGMVTSRGHMRGGPSGRDRVGLFFFLLFFLLIFPFFIRVGLALPGD